MGTEVGDWLQDRDGYYIGSGGIHVTARDAARFGWHISMTENMKGVKSSPRIGCVIL
jgi:hypothetical protein